MPTGTTSLHSTRGLKKRTTSIPLGSNDTSISRSIRTSKPKINGSKKTAACIRNLIIICIIFYAGMMIISFEAHGHVTENPVPSMKQLIPISLNHDDYKYNYQTYHSETERIGEEDENGLNFFPVLENYDFDSYSNENERCPITVVYVHPYFANLKRGSPSLFAIESIAVLMPKACIVIQTSQCSFENQTPKAEQELQHMSLLNSIYKQSFSIVEGETHDMMDRGQVRMTFLNHTKYNLPACDDFSHFSRALMNVEYWRDEFGQRDSETVMMVQDGLDRQKDSPSAVLCHSFDLEALRKFAFVATPLEQNGNIFSGVDHCTFIKDKWTKSTATTSSLSWLANIQKACLKGVAPMPLQSGFTLQNRIAMRRAIETCPHHQWSGMNVNVLGKDRDCIWQEEDDGLYFSTVFAAMSGVVLPTGAEASYFSVKEMWPEQAMANYGGPFFTFNRQVLAGELTCIYEGASVIVQGRKEKHTIPISFDLGWTTNQSKGTMQTAVMSHDVIAQCPFIKYVL